MLPAFKPVVLTMVYSRISIISVILCGCFAKASNDVSNATCPAVCKCSSDDEVFCYKVGIKNLPPDLPASSMLLNLAGNVIRILPFNAFRDVPALQVLWLNQNNLTFLYPGAFIALGNLKELNLSWNPRLTYLHAHTFRGLVTLISLDLSHCNVFDIHPLVFLYVSSLEFLDLSSNKMNYIPQALRKLHNVTRLSMENNHIAAIGKNSFKCQQALEDLNLQRNRIWAIHEEAFNHLNKLSVLNLGHNFISHLPNQLFSGLDQLRIMYLQANKIDKINCSFNGLVRLKKLHLNNNRITHIRHNAFSSLKQLQFLQLNKNNLTSLPHYLFSRMPKLKGVFLSYNPWSCECSMAWIANWMVTYKGTIQGLNCIFALTYRTTSEVFTHNGVVCFQDDMDEDDTCLESSLDSAPVLAVHSTLVTLLIVGHFVFGVGLL
ncbi:insulin-like growth factor-binding protein complex acid labile subunit [Bufo bufo]|uniref:insulin-like growth factor-binding protein complex acid labile subunit n=1 Tax=Bufo bufo TaxID=8384 RepID=UPI001ABDD3F8|nr:insulin-like growth factor-binding protein complex acid labile subunit [Bufo bufo]